MLVAIIIVFGNSKVISWTFENVLLYGNCFLQLRKKQDSYVSNNKWSKGKVKVLKNLYMENKSKYVKQKNSLVNKSVKLNDFSIHIKSQTHVMNSLRI